MKALIVLAALLLAACGSQTERQLSKVQPPQVVTKVVETFRPLPSWATEQLPNVPPKDGTVESLKNANNARADTIDRANCERRLLVKIEKGEKVDAKACRK